MKKNKNNSQNNSTGKKTKNILENLSISPANNQDSLMEGFSPGSGSLFNFQIEQYDGPGSEYDEKNIKESEKKEKVSHVYSIDETINRRGNGENKNTQTNFFKISSDEDRNNEILAQKIELIFKN